MYLVTDRRRLLRVRRLLASGRRAAADESGIGIASALSVATIVFLLGAVITNTVVHQAERSTFERRDDQALHVAESGLNQAMAVIVENGNQGTVTYGPVDVTVDGEVVGSYDYTIAPASSDAEETEFTITAQGWGPTESDYNSGERIVRSKRKLEADVELKYNPEFEHVLFAQTNLSIGDNFTVVGDMYAGANEVIAGTGTNIMGNVHAWGNVTSDGNISGTVHAAGNVTISGGTVSGDVYAAQSAKSSGKAGNIDASGATEIKGLAWARNNITPTPPDPIFSGGTKTGSEPPRPTQYQMPVFDPTAYTWDPTVDTLSEWNDYFDANHDGLLTAIEGNYQITGTGGGTLELGGTDDSDLACAVACPTITSWKMTDDVVIYTDKKVELSADITNGTSRDLQLVIVTTTGTEVNFVGGVSAPDSIDILIHAENANLTTDSATQTIDGAIYAKTVTFNDNFHIEAGSFSSLNGFSFPLPGHIPIEVTRFREVDATP